MFDFCRMCRKIYVLCTGFFGKAGVTGIVRPPWTSGYPDFCQWATRAPWPSSCCWNQCHHKAILWISFTNIPQFFLHASWRPRTVDPTNQRPTGGVNHRKSDLKDDEILQPDAVSVSVSDAIIGNCTTSRARGWSLRSSCQHKGELCCSLRERSKDGWLRQMRPIYWRKSFPLGCPRKTLRGIHNSSQYPFVAWPSQGWCWGG